MFHPYYSGIAVTCQQKVLMNCSLNTSESETTRDSSELHSEQQECTCSGGEQAIHTGRLKGKVDSDCLERIDMQLKAVGVLCV